MNFASLLWNYRLVHERTSPKAAQMAQTHCRPPGSANSLSKPCPSRLADISAVISATAALLWTLKWPKKAIRTGRRGGGWERWMISSPRRKEVSQPNSVTSCHFPLYEPSVTEVTHKIQIHLRKERLPDSVQKHKIWIISTNNTKN